MNEIKTGYNKNNMSIEVSVRTTKFAASKKGIGVLQKSNPQSHTGHTANPLCISKKVRVIIYYND